MGRRKIAIQPITQERNRSITFQKRRHGLFKKAYELGILCSVDVAVIVFEERTDGQVKCYEYWSGDKSDVIGRRMRFQGERDIVTPRDFGPINISDEAEEHQDAGDDDGADHSPYIAEGGIKAKVECDSGSSVYSNITSGSIMEPPPPCPTSLPEGLHTAVASTSESHSSFPVRVEEASGYASPTRPQFLDDIPSDHLIYTEAASMDTGDGSSTSFGCLPPPYSNSPIPFPSHWPPQAGPSMPQTYHDHQWASSIQPHDADWTGFLSFSDFNTDAMKNHEPVPQFEWPVHDGQSRKPEDQSESSTGTTWLDLLSSIPSDARAPLNEMAAFNDWFDLSTPDAKSDHLSTNAPVEMPAPSRKRSRFGSPHR